MGLKLGQWIFGTEPKAWVEKWPTMTPEQQATLSALLGELSTKAPGEGAYGGQLTAGLSDLEGLSLDALEQKILQRATGSDVGATAESALQDVIKKGGGTVDFTDFYERGIRDPAIQEFRELTLPEITRRFGSSGAFGSDRVTAEQQGLERLGRTLASARGELKYKTETDAANRLLQAIGLTPGLTSGRTEELLKLQEGAALPRMVEQTKLTAQYGEFQRQQDERARRIQQILAALGLKTSENIPLREEATSGWLGPTITATSAAAAQGMGAVGMMSDRRLKTHVQQVGLLPSGLFLYAFRYVALEGVPGIHYGVMADEVERVMPEAVITRDDGYKLVDYSMLAAAGALSGVTNCYIR